jgi:hypothetical protein
VNAKGKSTYLNAGKYQIEMGLGKDVQVVDWELKGDD